MAKGFLGRVFFVFLGALFLASFFPQMERMVEPQQCGQIDEELLHQPIYQQQIDPAKAAIIEQAKYFRSIGEYDKARELFRSLRGRPARDTSVDKFLDQVTVTKEDPLEQKSNLSVQWDSSDRPVSTTSDYEFHPSLEVNYKSTDPVIYNNEFYVVCERWSGSTAPDKIRLTRSMNYGRNWYEAYALDSAYELSAPEIRQVADDYLGIVFVRKVSSTNYNIDFWRPKMADPFEFTYTQPDNSTGTKDVAPAIESDYWDHPDSPFVYIVYYRLAGSSSKLMFVRSMDAGLTWEDPVILWSFDSEPPYTRASVSYAVSGDVLWLAFAYEYNGAPRMRVLRSVDYGETWSSAYYWQYGFPITNVSIAANYGTAAWLVYNLQFSGNQDTYWAYGTSGGSSWSYGLFEGTTTYDTRHARLRTDQIHNQVYCSYIQMPNEVIIWKAASATPTTWTSLGNVKSSNRTVADEPAPIVISKFPTDGTFKCSVSWSELFYLPAVDYDIYFNSEYLPLATSTKMTVMPETDFTSSGPYGGPFSPVSMDYLVENYGTESIDYNVSVNQPWLSLSNTSGTLAAGNAATVTVSINSNANSLVPGIYTGKVTFSCPTLPGQGGIRDVTLTVTSTPGMLQVTPTTPAYFYMFRGGPVPTMTSSYTLHNIGGTTINWQMTKTKNWLTISAPTSGSLTPGATTDKTISINSNSLTLTEGSHTDTITFTNTTNGNGNTTRGVTLDVNYNMWISVRGTTNQIYQRELTTGGSLLSWRALAGYTDKTPASAIFINRDYIIVKSDLNNDIWYNHVDPNVQRSMGAWLKLDGGTPDKPAAAVFKERLYLVVRGCDNAIYIRSMTTSGTWSAWSKVPGGYTNVPPAIAAFNDYLYLIVKDVTDNKIWWNKMNPDGDWSGWKLMDGLSPSTAAMTEFNGQLYIVVRGSDSRLYLRSMSTSEVFTAWAALAGWTDDSPAICSFNNLLYLVVKGLGSNDIWSNSMTASGTWGTWTKMDGASPTTATLAAPKID